MYLGNDFLKEVVIGGGLRTPEHLRSGGYRYDILQSEGFKKALIDVRYVLEAGKGKSKYAVYNIVGTDIYDFIVHIRNPRHGLVKRGEPLFDSLPGMLVHRHMKIGGYTSGTRKYLNWIEYLDPKIKIKILPGVSPEYIGVNDGNHIPGTSTTMTYLQLLKKQRPDIGKSGVDYNWWWKNIGLYQLAGILGTLGRQDVIDALFIKRSVRPEDWYTVSSVSEYGNIWETVKKVS